MDDSRAPLPRECRLVRITGRVQGVGFREACVSEATAFGVTGWVRNRADGSVEVLLQGAAPAVARMQQWLAHGPPGARVLRADVTTMAATGERFDRFERRPSQRSLDDGPS